MLETLKSRARALKNEAFAMYLAAKDPRMPWYAKALILFVVAHTFSPIDVIPDFIPVLGYLDDLIITPLGLALAIRLIPSEALAEARETVARGAWSAVSHDLLGKSCTVVARGTNGERSRRLGRVVGRSLSFLPGSPQYGNPAKANVSRLLIACEICFWIVGHSGRA